MKSFTLLAFSSVMLAAAPALAQDAAPAVAPAQQPAASANQGPAAGATVLDTQGGTVGQIQRIEGENAVVSTGTVQVTMPLSSFAEGPQGPVIALTRAQLEAQAKTQAAAAVGANLVAGTEVKAADGASIGTVRAATDTMVTVQTASGEVQLPRNAFGAGQDGVRIGMTSAEFQAAVRGAAAAAPDGQ